MYTRKIWTPTEQEIKQLEELASTPWFKTLCKKAEFEFSEAWKYMITVTQSLDLKDSDDLVTLEKEGIHYNAVNTFLEEIKRYSQKYIWDEIPE